MTDFDASYARMGRNRLQWGRVGSERERVSNDKHPSPARTGTLIPTAHTPAWRRGALRGTGEEIISKRGGRNWG